ncbi:hypothetical protein SAMN05444280_12765 [Tangfeifania diversioriginum]|uniref:Uncharacterized protein n=1 Tax=Tangfeifania diversioriginum TaxID=1168035 RepID=A0A1M6LNJ6_9BACT|nr:hypothetical protein SAMN05444280_12765 [Tangfeifania diversioriginum]
MQFAFLLKYKPSYGKKIVVKEAFTIVNNRDTVKTRI